MPVVATAVGGIVEHVVDGASGRQATGIVEPAEFERTRQQVVDALGRMRVPGTDRPLCRAIHRREDLFTGAHAERLADVIAELDPDVEADLRFGSQLFEPNAGKPAYPHRGYHARDGLLAVSGPGVRAGVALDGAAVRDVMPTVMQLLELPVAPDRRGRALPVNG